MAQPIAYGQIDAAARQTANPERLSASAALLVWLALSVASWAAVIAAVRLLIG